MPSLHHLQQFLLENHVATLEMLEAAQRDAEKRKVSLLQCLIEKGIVTDETLARTLSKFYGVEFFPGPLHPDPTLVASLPAFTLQRHKVVPLQKTSELVTLAIADPGNILASDEIQRLTGLRVKLVCVTHESLWKALKALQSEPATPATQPKEEAHETIKHVERLLNQAIESRSSDLHFEPQAKFAIVRSRIDGVLYEIDRMELEQYNPILSRLKVLSGMDIVEKRISQDGRFSFKGDSACEVRSATLPTIHGEKIVLRLLQPEKSRPTLESLELGPERQNALLGLSKISEGLVLIVGPTGSGKTTSIYATLHAIDRKSHNLITIEDPVEYELEMANQVQINSKIGVTFASVLPTILRQDPDIILVGEIREEKTAQMCMRAAISGHLVFSTLHAPGAISTMVRLIDMGTPAHLIVAALKASISQRLVRKLCPCKEAYAPSSEEKTLLGIEQKNATLYRPKGCEQCHKLGYRGRIALMEILMVSDGIRDGILKRDPRVIAQTAKKEGFKTIADHGIERVLKGETSFAEFVAECS